MATGENTFRLLHSFHLHRPGFAHQKPPLMSLDITLPDADDSNPQSTGDVHQVSHRQQTNKKRTSSTKRSGHLSILCNICHKRFSRRDVLTRHIRSQHERAQPPKPRRRRVRTSCLRCALYVQLLVTILLFVPCIVTSLTGFRQLQSQVFGISKMCKMREFRCSLPIRFCSQDINKSFTLCRAQDYKTGFPRPAVSSRLEFQHGAGR